MPHAHDSSSPAVGNSELAGLGQNSPGAGKERLDPAAHSVPWRGGEVFSVEGLLVFLPAQKAPLLGSRDRFHTLLISQLFLRLHAAAQLSCMSARLPAWFQIAAGPCLQRKEAVST